MHESHHHHHRYTSASSGGGWLIIFADLLALMLTFFVLIYSMSSVHEAKWDSMTKSLSQRLRLSIATPTVVLPAADQSINRDYVSTAEALEYLYSLLYEKMQRVPPEQRSAVRMVLLRDRLVISLVGDDVFSADEASLAPLGRQLLGTVNQTVRSLQNQLDVIAYADEKFRATPLYPSRWELALSRAIEASKVLSELRYPYKINSYGRFVLESVDSQQVGDTKLIYRKLDLVIRTDKAQLR